jgi:cytochrome P450
MSQPPTAPVGTDPEAEKLFFGIMSNPMNDDPYTDYHALRVKAPALRTSDGTLVLSTYADCDTALRHRSLGKSDDMRGYLLTPVPEEEFKAAMALLMRSMSFANPPEHTRLRQQVSSTFTNRHVDQLRATITARTDAALDRLFDTPGGDFMTLVATPLPIAVMSDMLGIPEADRDKVAAAFQDFARLAEPIMDAGVFTAAAAAERELADYFCLLLAAKREKPGQDLLSRLAATESALEDTEIVATVLLLFGAGIETTTNLFGNGLYTLLTHPDQLARLRKDPALILTAIEEILRFESPVHLDARTVLEPVTMAGHELPVGATVTTLLAAANRDPERFADPDRFDVGRQDNAHLSFAAGPHFCLGAHLTRLETQVLLERLVARTRELTLQEGRQRRAGLGLRGYASLPVTARTA